MNAEAVGRSCVARSGLLEEVRTKGVPDGLGDAVRVFKEQFVSGAEQAAALNSDVSAAHIGEAHSHKTLATE